MEKRRKIRVGRIKYIGGKTIEPTYQDFTPIVVLTKSSPYGELGPYVLKDENGIIMENKWQFSKVYPWVPKTIQKYSRWDSTVIWDYPQEVHINDQNEPNSDYWKWRSLGLNCKYAVRYPVGKGKHRGTCLYALKEKDGKKLDYIEARKEIYLSEYCSLVKKQPKFHKLKQRLDESENLLIIEVDGPHQEDLNYYKDRYNVKDDFIQNDSMEATKENIKLMLNDVKNPFGHGYCLATALLDLELD